MGQSHRNCPSSVSSKNLFPVLEVGGDVRYTRGIFSHLQASSGQLLQGDIRKGAVVSPENMDLDHCAVLNLRPLAHQRKPPRIQFQVLRTFWLLQVLPEVLVADREFLERVLWPAPIVVGLKENGSPWLGQQCIRSFGVLADLKIELRTYLWKQLEQSNILFS